MIGECLTSKNGKFSLTIGPEGLLAYLQGPDQIWETSLQNPSAAGDPDKTFCKFQKDGNFICYREKVDVTNYIWATQTDGPSMGYRSELVKPFTMELDNAGSVKVRLFKSCN
jgi:hypothetical protein